MSALRTVAVVLSLWLAVVALHAAPGQVEQLIQATASYESGQSMQPLRQIEQLVRQSGRNPALRQELEEGLLRLLTTPSTLEAKQFACEQLTTIGTERSLPALAELLVSPTTTALACQTLSSHPSAKANDVLCQALATLRGAARLQVINTLGDRQDARSVQPLAGLLDNPDVAVARAAILALGKIADAPARTAIAAVRQQARPELTPAVTEASMNAAEKLAAAGESATAASIYIELLKSTEPDNVRRGAFEALLQLDQDNGEQRILQTLRGSDSLLKPVAIAAIRRLRSASASANFAGVLSSLPPQEQIWLIQSLAQRPDRAAQSAVQATLFSTDALVRFAAIDAIGRSGEASAAGFLCKAMAVAPTAKERVGIERALTSLHGGVDVDAVLLHELNESPAPVQSSLMLVLARRESRAAIPALLKATTSPETGEVAFRALGMLATADDLPMLLDQLLHLQSAAARSEAENAVAQALFKLADPSRRAEALLTRLKESTPGEARLSLLRLLPSAPDTQALAALRSARTDSDAEIRDTAIRALAEWPNDLAWDSLSAILQEGQTDAYRVLALNALVRLVQEENARPNIRLFERYKGLLAAARSDPDRILIVGALAGVAHPEAIKLVQPLLANSGVRAEADLAIKQISAAIQKEQLRQPSGR